MIRTPGGLPLWQVLRSTWRRAAVHARYQAMHGRRRAWRHALVEALRLVEAER